MSSRTTDRSTWMDVTNESVHTSDDEDIGDIEAINRDFIVVKKGFVKVHYYYIPIAKVEGWDGHVVWLKVTEEEVKRNYERDNSPDPDRFYKQDTPYIEAKPYPQAYFQEMPIIPAKGNHNLPSVTRTDKTRAEALGVEQPRRYSCALCESSYNNEDELSNHVIAKH